jgi:hypothetical protein
MHPVSGGVLATVNDVLSLRVGNLFNLRVAGSVRVRDIL